MSDVVSGIAGLKVIDTKDDRRELLILMSRLTVQERMDYLRWCAARTNDSIMVRSNPPWVLVEFTPAAGNAIEACYDLYLLVSQFGGPLLDFLAELERRVSLQPRLG